MAVSIISKKPVSNSNYFLTNLSYIKKNINHFKEHADLAFKRFEFSYGKKSPTAFYKYYNCVSLLVGSPLYYRMLKDKGQKANVTTLAVFSLIGIGISLMTFPQMLQKMKEVLMEIILLQLPMMMHMAIFKLITQLLGDQDHMILILIIMQNLLVKTLQLVNTILNLVVHCVGGQELALLLLCHIGHHQLLLIMIHQI